MGSQTPNLLFALMVCMTLTFVMALAIKRLHIWLNIRRRRRLGLDDADAEAVQPEFVVSIPPDYVASILHKDGGLDERTISSLGTIYTYEALKLQRKKESEEAERLAAQTEALRVEEASTALGASSGATEAAQNSDGCPGSSVDAESEAQRQSSESCVHDTGEQGQSGGASGPTVNAAGLGTAAIEETPEAETPSRPAGQATQLEASSQEHSTARVEEGADELLKECPVCLAELQSADIVRVMHCCSNCFHQVCIDSWLKSKSSCPLCRKPFGQATAA